MAIFNGYVKSPERIIWDLEDGPKIHKWRDNEG
jgi:hypothetical protein